MTLEKDARIIPFIPNKMRSVVDYFKSREYKVANDAFRHSSESNHLQTPMDEGASLVYRLLKKGVISRYGPWLDAGCNDGRMVFSPSTLGIPSFGIERDPALFRLGQENLLYLRSLGLIPQDNDFCDIFFGDFLSSEPYVRSGIPFSSYATIYHHSTLSPPEGLVKKMQDESPVGTRFILVNVASYHPRIPGFSAGKKELIRDRGVLLYAHWYKKK